MGSTSTLFIFYTHMQTFTLATSAVNGLGRFVDGIPVAKLKDVNSVRLSSGIVKDLSTAVEGFITMHTEITEGQETIMKKYREEMMAMPIEERKEQKEDINQRLVKELESTLKSKSDELEELGKVMATVELGDDKYNKLKELFTEHAIGAYTDKDEYVSIADALEIK